MVVDVDIVKPLLQKTTDGNWQPDLQTENMTLQHFPAKEERESCEIDIYVEESTESSRKQVIVRQSMSLQNSLPVIEFLKLAFAGLADIPRKHKNSHSVKYSDLICISGARSRKR